MSRWLPYPLLSLALLLVWLLLTGSLSPAHLLLGAIIALCGGLLLRTLELPRFRPRRVRVIVSLLCVVLQDILRSNRDVARILLSPRPPRATSGFVTMPLELSAPHGLAALAVIITATPGTLWVNYDSSTRLLTIHVLDLVDEATWVRTIKGRYETRLMEIFE